MADRSIRLVVTQRVVSESPELRVTETQIEWLPRVSTLERDEAGGPLVATDFQGETMTVRDRPARYLVLEPDPDTGELRPAMTRKGPRILHLCRDAGL